MPQDCGFSTTTSQQEVGEEGSRGGGLLITPQYRLQLASNKISIVVINKNRYSGDGSAFNLYAMGLSANINSICIIITCCSNSGDFITLFRENSGLHIITVEMGVQGFVVEESDRKK